jgi:rhamnosyltransferase
VCAELKHGLHFETKTAVTKTTKDFLEETLVILVIYRCVPEKSTTWSSLVREAARVEATIHVFVYDNSPEPQHFSPSPFIRMEYKHNPDNPGVSKAYNEGCAVARGKAKKWLLLLDQDTSFPTGWLAAYFHNTVEEPLSLIRAPILSSGSFIISPFLYWLTKGVPSRRVEPGVYSLHRYFAVNSGLLIDRNVFESVGGYDEAIPLDFSDFAFMNKLKKDKYRLNVIELQGQHRLSSISKMDESNAKQRFNQYCLGSKQLTAYTRQSILHFFLGGARAIRLGIQYRSLNFVAILIQSWVTG